MAHILAPGRVVPPASVVLRHATRVAHETAERGLALPHGLRDRAHYAALLTALHGVYDALEREASAAEALHPAEHLPGGSARAGLIAADLAALGHAPPPGPRPPGVVDHPAAAAGVRYVLEGAALGGAVLAPRIERHLGLRPGEATAHWRGAGPDTAGRWRAFRARLDAWGDRRDPADHDRAVRAAERTFDLVAGALRRALDAPA